MEMEPTSSWVRGRHSDRMKAIESRASHTERHWTHICGFVLTQTIWPPENPKQTPSIASGMGTRNGPNELAGPDAVKWTGTAPNGSKNCATSVVTSAV